MNPTSSDTMQARPMPSWAFPRAYIRRPEGSPSEHRVAWNRPSSPAN